MAKLEGDLLIVAAEASSALYALRLLEKFKSDGSKVCAFGIGDAAMEAQGFEILGRAEDLAVFGVMEILAHYQEIKSAYYRILTEVDRRKPKAAILMDYPGFNLRLAKDLKKRGIKVIYYISPQVWAWKQGRVKIIRKYVDEMLVLFPFEEDWFRRRGVKATFVGHPLLDELGPDLFQDEKIRLARDKFGIPRDAVVLGLMPGSRRGEIQHHLGVQLQAVEMLKKKIPNLSVLLMVAPTLNREELAGRLSSNATSVTLIQRDPFEMIAMADVILCASGTASLMVGMLKKPMVIMYRTHPITMWIAKFLTKVRFFGLPNLIAGREIVPERLQVTGPEMAELLEPLLSNETLRAQQKKELEGLVKQLGEAGATGRVAGIMSSYIGGPL